MKKRLFYLLGFICIFLVEAFIALYVRDEFIRPYVGDMIVIILIYFFVKIIIPRQDKWLPAKLFVFAAIVEVVQLFNILKFFNLEHNRILSILLGSTFDLKDIACYFVGMMFLMIIENGKKNI